MSKYFLSIYDQMFFKKSTLALYMVTITESLKSDGSSFSGEATITCCVKSTLETNWYPKLTLQLPILHKVHVNIKGLSFTNPHSLWRNRWYVKKYKFTKFWDYIFKCLTVTEDTEAQGRKNSTEISLILLNVTDQSQYVYMLC